VKKVKKKVTLIVLALGFLMLFAAAAPAMASSPDTKGTYTAFTICVPFRPGTTTWVVDHTVETITDLMSHVYEFGGPWGPVTGVLTSSCVFDVSTFTGYAWGQFVMTVGTSTGQGFEVAKFTGPGSYTWYGPPVDGIAYKASFLGALYTGISVDHVTSGTLLGLEEMSTFTGVLVMSGPYTGLFLASGTTHYMLP
jgi:hypothetical protein